MNRWLLGALAISVSANLWLLARGPSSARPVPAPPRAPATPPPAAAPDGRIAALQAELAAARAEAAELRKPAAPVESPTVAAAARSIAAMEPMDARRSAAFKFGQGLRESDGAAAEILAALLEEKDPAVLAVLGLFLRGGAARMASPEVRRACVELLRTGALPEQRIAAIFAFWPYGRDDGPYAMEALNAALRTEPSEDVVGAVGEALSVWPVPLHFGEGLEIAADRLPAGTARRSVYTAMARDTFLLDGGKKMFDRFEAATAQDVKDDIAAALGLAGNQGMTSRNAGEPLADTEARAREMHDRYLKLYRGASELETRQRLAKAAQFGFSEAYRGIGLAGLYRELAEVEPDPAQKERLLAAAALDHGKIGSDAVDRALTGRE